MNKLNENIKIEDSFMNYISDRVDEELHSLLLQDPEYINAYERFSKVRSKISDKFTYKEWNEYEYVEWPLKGLENHFYYLQGLKDGLKLKKLLESIG